MAGTRVAQLWSAVEIASMRFISQLAILCSSQSFKTEARKRQSFPIRTPRSRDSEMHQTRKRKNWYFGMKAHVGVDSNTKLIHTAVATAANVSDGAMLPDLLHGEETRVWGDGAYQGQTEVIRDCAPEARDFTQRRCRYKGQIVDEVAWAKNRTKSKVRAKVEHVFQVMKLKFGFVKVRYRGLKKNAHRLFVTCALVNLFVSRNKLLLAA